MSETAKERYKCVECGEDILREQDGVCYLKVDVVEGGFGGPYRKLFPGQHHVTYRHEWCPEGSAEWLK